MIEIIIAAAIVAYVFFKIMKYNPDENKITRHSHDGTGMEWFNFKTNRWEKM